MKKPALSDAQFNWLRDLFQGVSVKPVGRQWNTVRWLKDRALADYEIERQGFYFGWVTVRGAAVLGQEAARRGLEVVALRKRSPR